MMRYHVNRDLKQPTDDNGYGNHARRANKREPDNRRRISA